MIKKEKLVIFNFLTKNLGIVNDIIWSGAFKF
jgi:hypothetical protein